MELVRKLLLLTEGLESFEGNWSPPAIEGYSGESIAFHVCLLHEAGLVIAEDGGELDVRVFYPQRLTWAGCEFLDAARDNTIWNQTKKQIGSLITSAPFELLKAYLIHHGKKTLGIPD